MMFDTSSSSDSRTAYAASNDAPCAVRKASTVSWVSASAASVLWIVRLNVNSLQDHELDRGRLAVDNRQNGIDLRDLERPLHERLAAEEHEPRPGSLKGHRASHQQADPDRPEKLDTRHVDDRRALARDGR